MTKENYRGLVWLLAPRPPQGPSPQVQVCTRTSARLSEPDPRTPHVRTAPQIQATIHCHTQICSASPWRVKSQHNTKLAKHPLQSKHPKSILHRYRRVRPFRPIWHTGTNTFTKKSPKPNQLRKCESPGIPKKLSTLGWCLTSQFPPELLGTPNISSELLAMSQEGSTAPA